MARRSNPPVSGRKRLAVQMRVRRRHLGLSQEELAAIAGIHRTYVGAVEREERNISIDNVEKIAIALQMDIAEILAPLPIS
ncbi:MAG: helix-turn-helix transcriptional regulator [Curvibacter sp.]|jgi:transcriptional regulator with XRE-family HTH domain|nr:helix-turn-helix transcriptional regulator [Burkholderiales bacterium]PHM20706.1 MAG: transcriptional regulator [Curvibacter sp. PD_MW3]HBH39051.1 transcriptional regulator [Curvibacter sp.]|tara:strand:+ start:452 stop:694 length:243 start_codon:yes stop_codon:yes gene_type:complete